jgi:ABC-type Zn2+ transport system substrate-binding protein/surface adhesin
LAEIIKCRDDDDDDDDDDNDDDDNDDDDDDDDNNNNNNNKSVKHNLSFQTFKCCTGLTFTGPCIVIYSYSKTNQMHLFLKLLIFV